MFIHKFIRQFVTILSQNKTRTSMRCLLRGHGYIHIQFLFCCKTDGVFSQEDTLFLYEWQDNTADTIIRR